jgi:hypothetical protein
MDLLYEIFSSIDPDEDEQCFIMAKEKIFSVRDRLISDFREFSSQLNSGRKFGGRNITEIMESLADLIYDSVAE